MCIIAMPFCNGFHNCVRLAPSAVSLQRRLHLLKVALARLKINAIAPETNMNEPTNKLA